MTADPSQRRRFPRYEVQDVSGGLLLRFDVKVLNLSLTGMAVETAQQLKPGRGYSVRFSEGPGRADGTDTPGAVNIDGTVRWCHLLRTRRRPGGDLETVYNAGISFDGLLTEKANQLLAFMNEHVILSLEQRVMGRYRLKRNSAIELEARYDFEVLKLSLSGMLVRTEGAPEPESVCDLELFLGGTVFGAAGRVANVAHGGTEAEPSVNAGIEFVGLEEESKGILRNFIAAHLE